MRCRPGGGDQHAHDFRARGILAHGRCGGADGRLPGPKRVGRRRRGRSSRRVRSRNSIDRGAGGDDPLDRGAHRTARRRRRSCRPRAARGCHPRRWRRRCRLAPRRWRRLAPAPGAEHNNRLRCQRQRRHQPGGTAADDDGLAVQRAHLTASMRSTDAPRRRHQAGSIVHFGLHRLQAFADIAQRDALHMRAEIAGAHEFRAGMSGPRHCRSSSIR